MFLCASLFLAACASAPAATETALANAVNALFQQTAVAGQAATQYAIANPSPTITPDPEQDPAYAAQMWTIGFLNGRGDLVTRYTCQQELENMQMASLLMALFGGGLNTLLEESGSDGTAGVDVSNLTFTTISQQGNAALVHVGGEGYLGFGGAAEEIEANGQLTMAYEDGRWKWCDPDN
jgi:hypothetical protein